MRKDLLQTNNSKRALKSAAIVILNRKKQILLLKRRPEAHWMPDKWGLPGGIIEPGEHCVDAALRETLEETSLKVSGPRLLSIDENVAVYYSSSYKGKVEIDYEHTDWAWVSREKLTSYDKVPNIGTLYEMAVMYERLQRGK